MRKNQFALLRHPPLSAAAGHPVPRGLQRQRLQECPGDAHHLCARGAVRVRFPGPGGGRRGHLHPPLLPLLRHRGPTRGQVRQGLADPLHQGGRDRHHARGGAGLLDGQRDPADAGALPHGDPIDLLRAHQVRHPARPPGGGRAGGRQRPHRDRHPARHPRRDPPRRSGDHGPGRRGPGLHPGDPDRHRRLADQPGDPRHPGGQPEPGGGPESPHGDLGHAQGRRGGQGHLPVHPRHLLVLGPGLHLPVPVPGPGQGPDRGRRGRRHPVPHRLLRGHSPGRPAVQPAAQGGHPCHLCHPGLHRPDPVRPGSLLLHPRPDTQRG